MEKYEVRPVFAGNEKADIVVTVPGSKSITNRALLLAALSDGETMLNGALFSDDSRHFIQCLKDLGFEVEDNETDHTVHVRGLGGVIPGSTLRSVPGSGISGSNDSGSKAEADSAAYLPSASINVGSAGTAARFLTAMLGFAPGTWHLDSSAQMKKRPMKALLDTLTALGVRITCEEQEGFFPFTIHSDGIAANEATVNIGDSSQFLSALLMSALMKKEDFTIHVQGEHGYSYIQMTAELMRRFGAGVTEREDRCFLVSGNSHVTAGTYQIEPDVSAAAYFYAMAAISGGTALVRNVHWNSQQGDIEFLRVLEKMGCTTKDTPEGIRLTGPARGQLLGIDVDMSAFSDQALTLAAIAPYASSPVTIRNIGHIRLQESDRIGAIITNLTAMGIRAEDLGNDVRIYPGTPQPASVKTYDDHRVAMAFAVTGLRAPGIVIEDPHCCRKTFENYFEVLDKVCQRTVP